MDAFSVSLANGLADGGMKLTKVAAIAGTFALFQFVMPMTGWALVHSAVEAFSGLEKAVPWIALGLLSGIGIKMIADGLRERGAGPDQKIAESLGAGMLLLQGLATSIDALSVGFTNASYALSEALLSALVIGAVTLVICAIGCLIGRRLGTGLAWKSSVIGGLILIAIGIRIILQSA